MRLNLQTQKVRLLLGWQKSGLITNPAVLAAFEAVRREDYISSGDLHEAYGDYPLTIPCGQTISQPSTVMIMLQALQVEPGMKILEIGAGSGYQAAMLSELSGKGGRVISLEYHSELALWHAKTLTGRDMEKSVLLTATGAPVMKKRRPSTGSSPPVPVPQFRRNG